MYTHSALSAGTEAQAPPSFAQVVPMAISYLPRSETAPSPLHNASLSPSPSSTRPSPAAPLPVANPTQEADELMEALSQIPYLSATALSAPRTIYQPPTVLQLRNAGAQNIVALTEAYMGLPVLCAQIEVGPYASPFLPPYPPTEDARLESLWLPEPIDWDAVVSELHHAGARRPTREEARCEEAFWRRLVLKRQQEHELAEKAKRVQRQTIQHQALGRASISSIGGSTALARGPPSVFESAFNTPMSRQPSLTASAHTPVEAAALGSSVSAHRRRTSLSPALATSSTTTTSCSATQEKMFTPAQRTAKGLLRRARFNGNTTTHRVKAATASMAAPDAMQDTSGFRFPILSIRSLGSTTNMSTCPDLSVLSLANSSELASVLTPNTARTGIAESSYSPMTATSGTGDGHLTQQLPRAQHQRQRERAPGLTDTTASTMTLQAHTTASTDDTSSVHCLPPICAMTSTAATTAATAGCAPSAAASLNSAGASPSNRSGSSTPALARGVSDGGGGSAHAELTAVARVPASRSPRAHDGAQGTRGPPATASPATRPKPSKGRAAQNRPGPRRAVNKSGPPSRAVSDHTQSARTGATAPTVAPTTTTTTTASETATRADGHTYTRSANPRVSRIRLPPLAIPHKGHDPKQPCSSPSTAAPSKRHMDKPTPLRQSMSYYSDGSARRVPNSSRSLKASASTMVLAPEPLPTCTTDSGSRGTTNRSHPTKANTNAREPIVVPLSDLLMSLSPAGPAAAPVNGKAPEECTISTEPPSRDSRMDSPLRIFVTQKADSEPRGMDAVSNSAKDAVDRLSAKAPRQGTTLTVHKRRPSGHVEAPAHSTAFACVAGADRQVISPKAEPSYIEMCPIVPRASILRMDSSPYAIASRFPSARDDSCVSTPAGTQSFCSKTIEPPRSAELKCTTGAATDSAAGHITHPIAAEPIDQTKAPGRLSIVVMPRDPRTAPTSQSSLPTEADRGAHQRAVSAELAVPHPLAAMPAAQNAGSANDAAYTDKHQSRLRAKKSEARQSERQTKGNDSRCCTIM